MKRKRKRKSTLGLAVWLIALGGATQALSEQRLSGEQQNACGSILCLLGGVTSGECASYLNPFFALSPPDLAAKRLTFLGKCPTGGDMPAGLTGMIASRGSTCQPTTLVARLNADIVQCESDLELQYEQGFDARVPDRSVCKPREDGWRGLCGSWHDSSYTVWQPPVLTSSNCRGYRRDGEGIGCTWRWMTQ